MPRLTPEFEIDRMNERMFNESATLIQDRDSFDLAFSEIMEADEGDLSSKQKAFREDVWNAYRASHPNVRPDRLFSKAEGDDLKKDRKTTEPIVKSDVQFIKKGAKKFDFAGFDVKESEINRAKIRARKEFVIPAIIKKKVVFVQKTYVNVKGREQVRYRDKFGRFASINR